MPPRRLILLRHGQTQANRDGIWQGHLDVALTEAG
ncbi:MAG: histidine phosphatase family protein, partial [Nostocoides sp.]